jgi:Bacterial Ig domain/Carboxypeptidase regulatory-like domain
MAWARTHLCFALLVLTGISAGLNGCAAVGSPSSSGSAPQPPAVSISNVDVTTATTSAVQISWVTNVIANSEVDFGTTTSYSQSTPLDPNMVTVHKTMLSGLTAGIVYHFRVRSTNAEGNAAVSPDGTFSTSGTGAGGDSTPPTVTLTAPSNGSTVSGTVNITATATDNKGVVGVQFQVDGFNAGMTEAAPPYSLSWDTSKMGNGAHTLTAFAKDAAGNATTSAPVTVTVKNVIQAQTFTISGTISPTAGGSAATVNLTGAANATTTANASGAYLFSGLANGTYTVSPEQAGFGFSPASQNATINDANVTGLNFAATSKSGMTFTISGTISPAAGGSGATITLNGAANATTTANASGAYNFSGLSDGVYAITPTHTGFTFSPASLNSTIKGGNVTGVNFTATAATTAPTFSISGTINPVGTGGNGATVTLSGAANATVMANSSGGYSFTGLTNGAYTVTPSHTGFTFSPASESAIVNGANVTGLNFAATGKPTPTFSISGTVSPAAAGSGATITLTGADNATATANASGAYTFTGLNNGAYTVTVIHKGFAFSVVSQTVAINNANVSGVNFAGIAQPPPVFNISGTISPVAGGNGATVILNGATKATTTANASGGYTFTGLADGTYTVSPSHAGFTFSPSSQNATINGANVNGLNFTAAAKVAPTFSVSGTISPTAGGDGAMVTLTGAANATTTANASGAYTFAGLVDGAYTVTPTHAGFTFNPTGQNTTISGADVTGLNFTANAQTAPTFTISGTIGPTAGGNGATVRLSGTANGTTTASNTGDYTFSGLANGTYTVTPSHAGFTFNPANKTATVSKANVTGVNFTATEQTFTLSGTVAAGGSGATVTLSGASVATTTTNASGAFTFTGLANGTYTVTPSRAGYTFTPDNQNITVNGANVGAINFTGTAQKFSISGTIAPAAGGAGASVTLSGASNATTTTSSSGAYRLNGLVNGTYAVTPSNSGFTFSPTADAVTVKGSDVAGVNFTASAQVNHSVTLNWSASASTVAGYNVYRSTINGSGYTKLTSTPITALSYDDSTVHSGTTYFYVTTAVDSRGVESTDSNQATATIP